MQRACFVVLLALLVLPQGTPVRADTPAADKERTERLARVGRLWGTVRYFHPHLAYKDIDWDAALVKALPKVTAARTDEEYAAAVQGMLDALGDPATRVIRRPASPAAGARARDPGPKGD